LEVSVSSGTDIDELIGAINTNYKTADVNELDNCVDFAARTLGSLTVVTSSVMFDIFGSTREQMMASKIFNDK
jgi:hypothetical protein